MARTKLPAVKRREYTIEEYNALFHAGQKGGGGGRGGKRISRAHAARWDARLVQVKAWVVRHRRYPVYGKTPAETSMYNWLRGNLPGKKRSYTPDRWKKLNDAFGEGWEADFGKGAHESQLEAKWDARLVQVKAWVVRHHRYPVYGKNPAETSMYNWLHQNLPGTKRCYTPARWKKLNDAFGERWEADFKTGSPSHREAKWDARLVQVKAWVVQHGRYPSSSRKTPAETSMYWWLRVNLPGKQSHTPSRWKKLNDAFGEGWEADFTSRSLPRLPV
jgi:hypothetical protein